jgi:trehalose/maltose hydrolase-like predicted phosphorylase
MCGSSPADFGEPYGSHTYWCHEEYLVPSLIFTNLRDKNWARNCSEYIFEKNQWRTVSVYS